VNPDVWTPCGVYPRVGMPYGMYPIVWAQGRHPMVCILVRERHTMVCILVYGRHMVCSLVWGVMLWCVS
jgi:hypothetical protein